MGGPAFNITTDTVTAASVGIGTESPGQKLDVRGSAYVQDVIYLGRSGVEKHFIIRNINTTVPDSIAWAISLRADIGGSNNNLKFTRFGDTGLYIDIPMVIEQSSGNVGINTATPSEKLEVSGNIKASGKVTVGRDTNLGVVFGDGGPAIYAFPAPSSRLDVSAGTVVVFGNDATADGGMHVRITGQGSFRVRDKDTAADRAVIDGSGSLLLGDSQAQPANRGGAIKQIQGQPNVGIASNAYDDLIFNYNSAVYWFKGTQGGGAQTGGSQKMRLGDDGLWFGPQASERRAIDSQGRCLYG